MSLILNYKKFLFSYYIFKLPGEVVLILLLYIQIMIRYKFKCQVTFPQPVSLSKV